MSMILKLGSYVSALQIPNPTTKSLEARRLGGARGKTRVLGGDLAEFGIHPVSEGLDRLLVLIFAVPTEVVLSVISPFSSSHVVVEPSPEISGSVQALRASLLTPS